MADMPFTVFHYTFNNVNYFKYGLVNKKSPSTLLRKANLPEL
jgi:hypothetical protein